MTTTTASDAALRKIFALRDRAAHANTPAAEADTALALARKLCDKYGVSHSVLEAKPEQRIRPDVVNGQQAPARKYPCRFGCGVWVQHTIDELNACAEKARNANQGNAYTRPRDRFEDMFSGFGFTEPNTGRRSNAEGEPKARATGSHAYCSHEATKSARAKCRRDRGF